MGLEHRVTCLPSSGSYKWGSYGSCVRRWIESYSYIRTANTLLELDGR